ncbi:hypothetical protein [Desulfococcus sp.]|uniref:hypothetical protein n=1 Tax=Desulfococcus sp. TaxID=2025834 RepID=UPI0035933030
MKTLHFTIIINAQREKVWTEMLDPESFKAWTTAFENYTLSERDGTTEVKVDMDAPPAYEEYMNQARPKALARLKEICDRS